MICDRCHGYGTIGFNESNQIAICPKCLGLKNIDWLENIIGVDIKDLTYTTKGGLDRKSMICIKE